MVYLFLIASLTAAFWAGYYRHQAAHVREGRYHDMAFIEREGGVVRIIVKWRDVPCMACHGSIEARTSTLTLSDEKARLLRTCLEEAIAAQEMH